MLVLTRKRGEHVVVGDNIRITVVAVVGNTVRLGFTAPRTVLIRREELLEADSLRAAVEASAPRPPTGIIRGHAEA